MVDVHLKNEKRVKSIKKMASVEYTETWRSRFQIGDLIDAKDCDGRWFESIILEVFEFTVKIHYKGWSAKYDTIESIYSNGIQPPYTRVLQWRHAITVGDMIEIKGIQNPPTWYIGFVLEQDTSIGRVLVCYGHDNNRNEWVDVYSEDITFLGTHVRKNQSVLMLHDTIRTVANAQNARWYNALNALNTTASNNNTNTNTHTNTMITSVPDFLFFCCICLNTQRNVLFLPCKHVCTCVTCSQNVSLRVCPLCKSTISQKMTVYI